APALDVAQDRVTRLKAGLVLDSLGEPGADASEANVPERVALRLLRPLRLDRAVRQLRALRNDDDAEALPPFVPAPHHVADLPKRDRELGRSATWCGAGT